MITTLDTINDYIQALTKRSNQVGGLDYAMGFLYSTLKELKPTSYELERLKKDTENLRSLIAEDGLDSSSNIF